MLSRSHAVSLLPSLSHANARAHTHTHTHNVWFIHIQDDAQGRSPGVRQNCFSSCRKRGQANCSKEGSKISSGRHIPVQCFESQGHGSRLRRGLTAMRSLNRPPGRKRLLTSSEDARRQARAANKTLKKCKKQAYVLKALWDVRTKISKAAA